MTVNCNRHLEGDRETPRRDLPTDWPWREASIFVRTGRLRWHLQFHPSARPAKGILVLLHGTGSSTHSWADLVSGLTPHSCVLTIDLPGHGFTLGASHSELTIPGMAQALQELFVAVGARGDLTLVGHSAGAPLAIQWALDHAASKDGQLMLSRIIGLNPSLVPPPPLYTLMLGPVITPLATSTPVTGLLAFMAANTRMVDQLLDSTASRIPDAQRARYKALFTKSHHVQGSMGFMAAADLPSLLSKGQRVTVPVDFLLGAQDPWVREAPLREVIARHFPRARTQVWPGGHLLHEERPADVARMITEAINSP